MHGTVEGNPKAMLAMGTVQNGPRQLVTVTARRCILQAQKKATRNFVASPTSRECTRSTHLHGVCTECGGAPLLSKENDVCHRIGGQELELTNAFAK